MFQSRQVQKLFHLDVTLKQKNTHNNKQSKIKKQNKKKQQFLSLNLINIFGLNSLLLNHLVFKTHPLKYSIRKINHHNIIICDQDYYLPDNITTEIQILEIKNHSIPVCRIIPKNIFSDTVIIYAHGNSSDLVQGIKYIQKISLQLGMQFVVFDYTGYGCSNIKQISQQSIRQDLQIVLAWITGIIPLHRIVLWGFSLGTYPVTYCGSHHKVKGIILQSPLASIGCSFKPDLSDPDIQIQNDYLVNLDYIHKIKSQIFIIHSKADQIIPFNHAIILAKKYCKYNNPDKLSFIEVNRLLHNQMHLFFASDNQNVIKRQLILFLSKIQYNYQQNINNQNYKKQYYHSYKINTQPSQHKQFKIKLISQNIFYKSVKKCKLLYLEQLRNNIKFAQIPEFNQKQLEEEFQIENGVIVRKFTPKVDRCFCLEKC